MSSFENCLLSSRRVVYIAYSDWMKSRECAPDALCCARGSSTGQTDCVVYVAGRDCTPRRVFHMMEIG